MYCIVGLRISLLLLILPCIFLFFFLSTFFVKGVCETVQARVFIFGMQVDNDALYRGIGNQPSPAYSSLYLSDFFSFHTLNDEISSQISVKLCKLEYSYLVCRLIMMYCIVGMRTSLLLLILPCIFLFFFLSTFFVKDVCETVQARVFIFGMQVDNDVLYLGIANQPSPAYSSLYLSNFLSFHILNDEIFRQRFL